MPAPWLVSRHRAVRRPGAAARPACRPSIQVVCVLRRPRVPRYETEIRPGYRAQGWLVLPNAGACGARPAPR